MKVCVKQDKIEVSLQGVKTSLSELQTFIAAHAGTTAILWTENTRIKANPSNRILCLIYRQQNASLMENLFIYLYSVVYID